MGPERAAEASLHTLTSRAAAKTSDVLVIGSLQKRVNGSASKADGLGPGTVLRRFMMKIERLGSVTQRPSYSTLIVTDEHRILGDDGHGILQWV